MKGIFAFSFLFLLSVPALGQTYLAHNVPELSMDEIGGAILLLQDNSVGECEDEPNPHACSLRKVPSLKRSVGASFSVLCADENPKTSSVKRIAPFYWGHNGYAMGVLDRPMDKDAVCLARRGSSSWGSARLRSLSSRPLQRPDIALIKSRIKEQYRRNLNKQCEEISSHSNANCERDVRIAFSKAVLVLYQAKLPGRRVGIATLRLPDPWGSEYGWAEGGMTESVATIDVNGSVVEFLATGSTDCNARRCGHVLGIGDLDGDGYEDLLFDARGEATYTIPGMGPIQLITWPSGRLNRRNLGSWMGG